MAVNRAPISSAGGRKSPMTKEIRDLIERENHPERKRTRAEIRSIEREIARIWRDGDRKNLMQFLRGIGLKD